MKLVSLLTILVLGLMIVGVVGAGINDLVKQDESFNSNLDATTKTWLSNNLIDIRWEGNLEATNDDNTYKMKFCYTFEQKRKCTKLGLIRDYESESLYCAEWGSGCLEYDKVIPQLCIDYNESYVMTCDVWANIPLKDMLEERYVLRADEVLARVYRNNNKLEPTKVDVGNKTINVT